MNKSYCLLIACCLLLVKVQAKITLSSILGDNMVLQQNSKLHVTGKAAPAKFVSVVASWSAEKLQTKSTKNGDWEIMLSTPTAGGPYTLTFSDGEKLVLKNILIGEVWFCSGQSNMEMPVKGFRGQPVYGSQQYIVSADEERPLRLFTVKNSWSTIPKSDGIVGHWSQSSSKEVADFSAAAYFFGELLQRTLKVPVGLINCSWSASKIEAWMNKETLSRLPEVELPDVNQMEFGWPAGTPTLLWNGMVNPWKGFPVKGVIWYQGEANSPAPDLYKKLFPAMVAQWRQFFELPDMPFYYVQIAPWQSKGKEKLDWALFRQCQLELMHEVPNVGMVTTTDAGSETFIHPPYKIKVGQRLAYWALAKTYGKEGFQSSGPIYRSCKLNAQVVEVTFDYGEDGLIPENQKLRGFELAGADGKFLPALAEIIGGSSRVKVWNDSIKEPVEVRYCFRNYLEGDLFNNAEIPASPFRAIIEK